MDEEIVSEFLTESRELLERVDHELVALEREPHSQALIASIFRSVHTMKGTAVCLGFSRFAWIAHNGENVLGKLRDGELNVDAAIAGTLLEMVDVLRQLLDQIEANRNEGPDDHGSLVHRLETIANLPTDGVPQNAYESFSQTIAPRAPRVSSGGRRVEQTIRVDVRVLDEALKVGRVLRETLIDLETHAPVRRTPQFSEALAKVDRLATELNETLRRTRMQPIGNLWIGFPRVVRDLSLNCNKRVRLETDGTGIEVDRSVLEAVKDPLSHLLRNAVDHGIEPPETRSAHGKAPIGLVSLSAHRSGRHVVVSVSDDGAGVDLERVRRRAVDRKLLDAERAELMGEEDLLQMLFVPGFSTAETVTPVSGRGVGLDVVKSNVENAGGRVEIVSTPGLGTTVRLRFADVHRPSITDVKPLTRRG